MGQLVTIKVITYIIKNTHTLFTDDLSFKAVASQSPIYIGPTYNASNAIDRNTATCMRTDAIGPNIQDKYRNTWWKVDLGAVYNIYSINILFKKYDGVGMHIFVCTSRVILAHQLHGVVWLIYNI